MNFWSVQIRNKERYVINLTTAIYPDSELRRVVRERLLRKLIVTVRLTCVLQHEHFLAPAKATGGGHADLQTLFLLESTQLDYTQSPKTIWRFTISTKERSTVRAR